MITQYSSSRLSEQGVNRKGQRLGSEFPMRVVLRRLPPQGLGAWELCQPRVPSGLHQVPPCSSKLFNEAVSPAVVAFQ